jgi:hypothetical protein
MWTPGWSRSFARYRHELTAADHKRLIETVLHMRASILLSGFDHPSYAALEQAGFERLEFDHHITASLAGRRHVKEVIWRRVAAGQNLTPTLWDTA